MASKKGKILIVDDNAGIRQALKILLPLHFSEVETLPSPVTLVSTLERFKPDVVLLDMNFNTSINTGNEGLYWAAEIKKMVPEVEVVLFTAYADIQLAVEGMKRGAFDFIVKPWDNDKLVATLTAARDKARKAMGRDAKSAAAEDASGSPMYWGFSKPMAAIQKTVDKIAPTDATVLITGENGTGKDVLAREIHARSLRSGKPMVAVDAGAITETLFESELFGHVKGAFTDAHTDHVGKFEQADGGTLFLFAPRIWIWSSWSGRAGSGKICTTASTPCISTFLRSGNVRRISCRWHSCSWSVSPRSITGILPGWTIRQRSRWKAPGGAGISGSYRTASRRPSSSLMVLN